MCSKGEKTRRNMKWEVSQGLRGILSRKGTEVAKYVVEIVVLER